MPWLIKKAAVYAAIIAACLSFVAFSGITAARRGEDAFQRAAALYQGGDYAGAARAYKAMTLEGQTSGAVYYNLGNCYFKGGELGRAVLQYERARRLIPADPALRANYAYALKTAGVDNEPRSFAGKLLAALTGIVATDGLILLALGFFLALLLALNALLLLRHRALGGGKESLRLRSAFRRLAPILAVICAILVCLAAWAVYEADFRDRGIVMAADAPARYEPGAGATIFFRLDAGSMVEIIRRDGGWILVGRPDGKRGWMEGKSVEKI